MKKFSLLIIILLKCSIGNGKNLINNGDFELFTACPNGLGLIENAVNWYNPHEYPGGGSPEYFNACSANPFIDVPDNYWGYQNGHSGGGYAGLNLIYFNYQNFREYIQTQFSSPLVANQCYELQMYVNLPNDCSYATDALEFYFSDTLVWGIYNYNQLPFTAQVTNTPGNYFTDTLNWVLFSTTYIASGGENFLIIGNFKDDANTAVLTVPGGSMVNGYLFIDDVTLSPCTGISEQASASEIKNYPNPFNDHLNFSTNNNLLSEINLYDISSKKILQQEFTNSVTLNTEKFAGGIYFYEITNINGVIKKGKVVKQ